MGNFASRIHSKEDGKIYNILPMGDMPTVVFGRMIREGSVPGMQYYFADGRVKFHDGDKNKRDNVSNGGGWDAVIPFTEPKKFSAIKFDSGDGETWLYKRYREGDRKSIGYAWAFVNNSTNKGIFDPSINWIDIDYTDTLYTDEPEGIPITSYDTSGEYEVLDFNDQVTSDSIKPTQIPVIFTIPEDLDFGKMKDVEYVKQFCRTAKRLNANTVSPNFVIIDGKIICIKQVNFGTNRTLSLYSSEDSLNTDIYNSGFCYKFLKRNSRKRREQRYVNNYKMHTRHVVSHCIHNEFDIIPMVTRNIQINLFVSGISLWMRKKP